MDQEGEQSNQTGGKVPHGDFSSVVIAAHEVKAPLSIIRQLSLELQDDKLPANTRKQLAYQLQLVSERALRFSSDLTKAQQLQSVLFETSPLNVLQLCDEVVREMSPLFSAHERRFGMKTGQVTTPVIANRDLLRRVLLNFADNALNYSAGDRIYLQASMRRSDHAVRLGIRDEGPALPANFWRKLTAQTPQPQSVHARPQSSGLGLLLSQQFADAIGSKIGLIRHHDGATFYIDVPVSTQLSLL